jgi:hypothetical protein
MVAVTSSYPSTSANYYNAAQHLAATLATTLASTPTGSTAPADSAATSVTLSETALAALAAERDFAQVVADAQAKLSTILTDANRSTPIADGKLAVDFGTIDHRELFAIGKDPSFSAEEQEAAGLEMQRRFEAALAGPAGVAAVTGNYTSLYRAAAAHLDALGPEEKAENDWIAGRAAITDALKQLQLDPKVMPVTDEADPVSLYLALRDANETIKPPAIEDVADSARKTLNQLYTDAYNAGKIPTFNKNTTVGIFIDMSKFDSRSLSAIALNTGNQFAAEEASQAKSALRQKSGAALVAGFQSAAKSSDPTAFSQNIIAIFESLSPEERSAAGWSDAFYQAAVDSYVATSKLTQLFAQAGGDTTGFMSWMGSR